MGGGSDPGNADSYEDRPLFTSVALSSLLFSFFSPLFSCLRDHFDLRFEALGPSHSKSINPCRKSSNPRFSVFLQWHAPRTQKSTPKASTGIPKAPNSSPQSDPGAPEGDPRAPKERPQSVPMGPSCVQEVSGRAVGRLRTSFCSFRSSLFHTFGTRQRPSNASQSLCSLLALLSPLLSFHPGFWDLARGLRTLTLGPNS